MYLIVKLRFRFSIQILSSAQGFKADFYSVEFPSRLNFTQYDISQSDIFSRQQKIFCLIGKFD